MAMRCFRPRLITVAIGSLVTALGAALPATAQAPVGCNETIDTRTTELGCWETASQELGSLPSGPLFWYLYNYPTRAAAEGNRDARGTVVQSFGRVWLFSIEGGGWRAKAGKKVAVVGPLNVDPSKEYTARYMEAVSTRGMQSTIHRHAGPEAWYMLSGSQCLETSQGIIVARPRHGAVVQAGPPMLLNTVGKSKRKAVVLVLHDSSQPWVNQAADWKPKGLCIDAVLNR
jgi:hypothetical protein